MVASGSPSYSYCAYHTLCVIRSSNDTTRSWTHPQKSGFFYCSYVKYSKFLFTALIQSRPAQYLENFWSCNVKFRECLIFLMNLFDWLFWSGFCRDPFREWNIWKILSCQFFRLFSQFKQDKFRYKLWKIQNYLSYRILDCTLETRHLLCHE